MNNYDSAAGDASRLLFPFFYNTMIQLLAVLGITPTSLTNYSPLDCRIKVNLDVYMQNDDHTKNTVRKNTNVSINLYECS